MPSDEMIETMMKKLKQVTRSREIMEKLNNPDYPEELKAENEKRYFYKYILNYYINILNYYINFFINIFNFFINIF